MLSPSIDGVEDRHRAQRVAHRLGDERHEGELRAGALVLAPSSALVILLTRVKSISNTECTCTEVCWLNTMCSAIFLRITVIGVTSTRSPGR